VRKRLLLAAVVVLSPIELAGCEDPVFNSNIGIRGVSTDDDSFTGAFAWSAVLADEADTVLGKVTTGGQTFYLAELVVRADAEDGASVYDTNLIVCDVVNFAVAGIETRAAQATMDAIPDVPAVFRVKHGTGEVTVDTFYEHWAVKGLGITEPLPEALDDAHFYDMDEDGKPGATIIADGLGESYVAQRKTVSMSGVITGPNTTTGLATHKKEGRILGATSSILETEAERSQHPNPKESWFFGVRISEATCAAVVDAKTSFLIPELPPFPIE
jgi:hypothetical protein